MATSALCYRLPYSRYFSPVKHDRLSTATLNRQNAVLHICGPELITVGTAYLIHSLKAHVRGPRWLDDAVYRRTANDTCGRLTPRFAHA